MNDQIETLGDQVSLRGITLPHPPTRVPGLFTRVDAARVEAIVREVDPQDDMARVRNRLWWFRLWCCIRAGGWAAGVVFGLSVLSFVLGGMLIFSTPLRHSPGSSTWLNTSLLVAMWSLVAWFYLYWGLGALAPSTRLARRVRAFEGQSAPGRRGLSRSSTIFTLEAAGSVARDFYRIVTRRTFTRTRPDLAADVGAQSVSLMLAIPEGGPDRLRRRPDQVAAYREFLKDVVGLLVVQRLDIVPELQKKLPSDVLVTPGDYEKLKSFLQPFGRRTTAEALTDFVVPVITVVLSFAAFVVSLVK